MQGFIEIKTTVTIPPQLIADLMTTVIESPAGQWLKEVRVKYYDRNPAFKGKELEKPFYANAEIYNDKVQFVVLYDDPDEEEGTFTGKKILTWNDIVAGFQKLADERPSLFADITAEDAILWDANTADSWFQYTVLGEEVYG